MIKLCCKECGKDYYRRESQARRSSFCSRKCQTLNSRVKKQCIQCGREYSVKKSESKSKYCSMKCRRIGMRNKGVVFKCKCGKEVTLKFKSYLKGRKFCSNQCVLKRKEISERDKTGSNNPNWGGGLVTLICNQCGKEYKRQKSDVKWSSCCSKECANALLPTTWKKKRIKQLKETKHFCEYCGKNIIVPKCKTKLYKKHFCSSSCHVKWIKESGFYVGKNNPNWKDGVRSLNSVLYACEEAENWKKSVRERDKYKCQHCGSNSNLHVHHIKKFIELREEFLKEYDQFSINDDISTLLRLAYKWKPFFEIDNGITLCRVCHAKEHARINSQC